MREALIKVAPIGGLPKVCIAGWFSLSFFPLLRKLRTFASLFSAFKSINGLLALKQSTPSTFLDEPLSYSPTLRSAEVYDVPSSKILHRGETFFDQVYGKVSKRVMGQLIILNASTTDSTWVGQMDRSGTEDLGIIARLLYGYVLSNTNVLNAAETSFVLLAGLIPQDVSGWCALSTW